MDRTRVIALTLALIAAIAVPLCASAGWARGLGVLGLVGGAGAVDPCAGTLVCELWNTSGVPSGWTLSSTADPDYPTTGLDMEGEQCLYLPQSGGPQSATTAFTTTGRVYGHVAIRTNSVSSAYYSFLRLYNGGNQVGSVSINNQNVRMYVGATATAAAYSFAADTTYHLFFDLDAPHDVGRVYVSTTTTRPGTPTLTASGDAVYSSVDSLKIEGNSYTGAGTYTITDQIIISTTDFSSIQ